MYQRFRAWVVDNKEKEFLWKCMAAKPKHEDHVSLIPSGINITKQYECGNYEKFIRVGKTEVFSNGDSFELINSFYSLKKVCDGSSCYAESKPAGAVFSYRYSIAYENGLYFYEFRDTEDKISQKGLVTKKILSDIKDSLDYIVIHSHNKPDLSPVFGFLTIYVWN